MEQSKLPMIELHLHLDGAIPPETMWELAQEKGVPMPGGNAGRFPALAGRNERLCGCEHISGAL